MGVSKTQQSIATDHAPYVRTFTFSDGSRMERCTLCSYGIGHSEQTPPIYTSRHYDTPVELELADHEEEESLDSLAVRLELLAPKPEPVAGAEDNEPMIEAEDADTGTVTLVSVSELDDEQSDSFDADDEGSAA